MEKIVIRDFKELEDSMTEKQKAEALEMFKRCIIKGDPIYPLGDSTESREDYLNDVDLEDFT